MWAEAVMHQVIEAKRAEIAALCREFGVVPLDVFGSAARSDQARHPNDVDLLVEVAPDRLTLENYFALRDALSEVLGRPVDLVDARAVKNPYFRAEVDATSELVYAA